MEPRYGTHAMTAAMMASRKGSCRPKIHRAHAEAKRIEGGERHQSLEVGAQLVLDPVEEVERFLEEALGMACTMKRLKRGAVEQEEVGDERHEQQRGHPARRFLQHVAGILGLQVGDVGDDFALCGQ